MGARVRETGEESNQVLASRVRKPHGPETIALELHCEQKRCSTGFILVLPQFPSDIYQLCLHSLIPKQQLLSVPVILPDSFLTG